MSGPRASVINDRAFGFGPFRLYRSQKLLLENGQPVRLGSRALDILIALLERAGEFVSKEELVAIVWPRTVVEESSLRVHVAALRKVLGDGQSGARYILNQPGRGYCFVAELARVQERPGAFIAEAMALSGDEHLGRLPARLTRMIGRAESVALLEAQLKFGRFVTIVGPGGIGKTTMALAVAEAQGLSFGTALAYIDLAPIANGALISSVLMAALGLSPRDEGLENLETFLRERCQLLVVDNCEHLLDALTPLVEHLLRCAPGLHVLATSREPMRAEGEWLHRLGALSAPPAGGGLSAEQALRYPAIELFIERATASVDDFLLAEPDVALLTEICHRLDGNPLAIELAAARVDLFGLRGLLEQLDAHVLELQGRRRDAPTRHHSLSAMLEWSYRLLSDTERMILNRLAVFQGWFPLRAATQFIMSVEGACSVREDEVFDGIADLAAKSLLTSDASGEVVQFRLLELTRAFALAQLDRRGERVALSNRHAAHILSLVHAAAEVWAESSKSEWFATHIWLIDEVRAALAWSFGGQGDVLTGCALTVALWSIANVVNPFDEMNAVERAMAALSRLAVRPPVLEMRLNIALATKYELIDGRTAEASAANARALELAQQCDNPELEAETLMAIVVVLMATGDYPKAAQAREQLAAAARRSGSAMLLLVADRFGAQTAHFAGSNAKCRTLVERVLSHPVRRGLMGTISSGLDHRISMRIMLSRTLWIEGFADQAVDLAEETHEMGLRDDALALTQTFSLCVCPVALWRGDEEAERHIAEFRAFCDSHISGGQWLPSSAVIPWWITDSVHRVKSDLHRDHLLTAYSRLSTPESAARGMGGEAGWCTAELLRSHGERLLREDAPGAVHAAQPWFERALATAVSQQALAWELRAATSLARLFQMQGREPEARALLAPVYGRFSEGFHTRDLMSAAALLEQLNTA